CSQMPVTFEDAVVSFCPQEWRRLRQWLKELYWHVTRDNYELVTSLGKGGRWPRLQAPAVLGL
ncbi:ZN786 protein, partial [Nothocercus nigrocapillus]|nr:ZN786 protein [Nothocercus nigrocapillus]